MFGVAYDPVTGVYCCKFALLISVILPGVQANTQHCLKSVLYTVHPIATYQIISK